MNIQYNCDCIVSLKGTICMNESIREFSVQITATDAVQ